VSPTGFEPVFPD